VTCVNERTYGSLVHAEDLVHVLIYRKEQLDALVLRQPRFQLIHFRHIPKQLRLSSLETVLRAIKLL
jgi:hypothetical protein